MNSSYKMISGGKIKFRIWKKMKFKIWKKKKKVDINDIALKSIIFSFIIWVFTLNTVAFIIFIIFIVFCLIFNFFENFNENWNKIKEFFRKRFYVHAITFWFILFWLYIFRYINFFENSFHFIFNNIFIELKSISPFFWWIYSFILIFLLFFVGTLFIKLEFFKKIKVDIVFFGISSMIIMLIFSRIFYILEKMFWIDWYVFLSFNNLILSFISVILIWGFALLQFLDNYVKKVNLTWLFFKLLVWLVGFFSFIVYKYSNDIKYYLVNNYDKNFNYESIFSKPIYINWLKISDYNGPFYPYLICDIDIRKKKSSYSGEIIPILTYWDKKIDQLDEFNTWYHYCGSSYCYYKISYSRNLLFDKGDYIIYSHFFSGKILSIFKYIDIFKKLVEDKRYNIFTINLRNNGYLFRYSFSLHFKKDALYFGCEVYLKRDSYAFRWLLYSWYITNNLSKENLNEFFIFWTWYITNIIEIVDKVFLFWRVNFVNFFNWDIVFKISKNSINNKVNLKYLKNKKFVFFENGKNRKIYFLYSGFRKNISNDLDNDEFYITTGNFIYFVFIKNFNPNDIYNWAKWALDNNKFKFLVNGSGHIERVDCKPVTVEEYIDNYAIKAIKSDLELKLLVYWILSGIMLYLLVIAYGLLKYVEENALTK